MKPPKRTVEKVAATVMLTLAPHAALAKESLTLKRYAEVQKGQPDIDEANVRVWTIRKTSDIRINLVEFRGELPLHQHPDADHSLMVLDGEVRVQAGNEAVVVGKGDFISVPAGVPHKYWTLSKTATLVSMDAPYYDPKKTVRLEE